MESGLRVGRRDLRRLDGRRLRRALRLHGLIFIVIGGIASRLLGVAEHNPNVGFGILLLFVVFEFGFVAVNLAFVAVVTRVLFALAFDRLLPIGLAQISERNAVPTYAIIVALAAGIVFALLASFLNLANIIANLALFVALIIVAGSVAATALPFRRPDLLLKPGTTELPKVAGIPVPALWGGASTILALTVVVLIVTHPEVFGAFSVSSVVTLVLVLGAGPVIYLIARQIRLQSSSIDLRLAMRELPPE